MILKNGLHLDYDDVLITPKRSNLGSRTQVHLEREFKFKHAGFKWQGVPLMAANMDGVGTFSMARALQSYKMLTVVRKHYNFEDWVKAAPDLDWNYTVVCCGTNAIFDPEASDYLLLKKVCATWPVKHLCIDVANGYQQNFIDFCKKIRDEFKDKSLCAGNVCTPEVVEELVMNAGVDMVKIGIGPGSVCTTRIVTGVGMPQLSAVMNCADIAHQHKGLVVADGGCKHSGDVMKAFGGGADFVMLGGVLAFHSEAEEAVDETGQMCFYGMSSESARTRHARPVGGFRTSEGKKVCGKTRGPVKETVEKILGGLRSGCTYIGATGLKEISRRTTFVQVNQTYNRVFGESGQ